MDELEQSIRHFAEFLDERAISHLDHRPEAPTDDERGRIGPSDTRVRVTDSDPTGGPGPSIWRSLGMVAAVLVLVVGGLTVLRLTNGPTTDTSTDGAVLPDASIVDPVAPDASIAAAVGESSVQADLTDNLLRWLNGELHESDFGAILGYEDGGPQWFHSEIEVRLAPLRPFVVREQSELSDRAELLLENATGTLSTLTVHFDDGAATLIDLMPAPLDPESEAASGAQMLEQQLRWMNGEAFTEADYVRSFVALDIDAYDEHVGIIDELARTGPHRFVVRTVGADGSSAALFEAGDGRLGAVGFVVSNGLITGFRAESSAG